MSKELKFYIEQICRDKGLSKTQVVQSLEVALLSAAKKAFGSKKNVNLTIDPETCEISITAKKKIVENVTNPKEEISLEDARKIAPEKEVGDYLELPVELHDFGRIAAQTAKQVIQQKVREAERKAILDEFKDKVGTIASGVVLRKEKGVYVVNLGRAEAVLPIKETLPKERLKRDDPVRAYIKEVRMTSKGPEIVLTRTAPEFVAELFKMEVPEIEDGVVEIKKIVREPGERTKLTVVSKDPGIDPVGACVGMKGTRVQGIVRELRGERIDIIPYNDDPRIFIARALTPAQVDKIGINEEDKTAMAVVSDQQLSVAIGKRGQNVKLAMKLTGWNIDIISESEYAKIKEEESEEQQSEE